MATIRSIPEIYDVAQLAVLAGLARSLKVGRYVLKGGANLRFFFASPRSSEDLDFDVLGIADWRLADHVEKALRAAVVGLVLRSHDLSIIRTASQKQTPTTQRWIIEVKAPGHRLPISTALEFSHRIESRGASEDARAVSRADPIDAPIAGRYGVPPIVIPHYLPAAAIAQKIVALAARATNQPRDVFDLDLLLGHYRGEAPTKGQVDPGLARQAADRATELGYEAFRDAVLPFVDLELRPFYEQPAAWSAMQDRVITYLLELSG
ncbi:MAG: hypothetical protein KatS3mg065_0258 [Chloroflexota bacterium]|nr:MAG: hypothetical protein KatS3mg065_0258 [Chloroflexota bacterium]